MNSTLKYAVVLVLVVIVSMATSYVTTLSLNKSNQQSSNSPSPQLTSSPSPQPKNTPTPQTTDNKIFPTYNVTFQVFRSYVSVYSNMVVHNLTIAYQYTSLNGTLYKTEIDYGDYFPGYGVGEMIEPGQLPYLTYRIPQSIMDDCSKVHTTYSPSDGTPLSYSWEIYPQLNVTEVYGYR